MSKYNLKFFRMIVMVKVVVEGEKCFFYLIMYKWVDGKFVNFIFFDMEMLLSF